jgi:hypothetical protein
VAPVAQLTEQEPVHVTVQLVPAAHETLPLSPTVTWHEEFGWQFTLHDFPHLPVQVLPPEHSSEQLSDVPHALELKSHWVPGAQVQLVPVHEGGTPAPASPEPLPRVLPLPPHARTKRANNHAARRAISSPPGSQVKSLLVSGEPIAPRYKSRNHQPEHAGDTPPQVAGAPEHVSLQQSPAELQFAPSCRQGAEH